MENIEPTLLWWIFFTIPLLISNMQNCAYGEPQVPCYFVFGDSLFDNGNNNNLSTLAKANYTPYGFDFSKGPTGRFSNGNNTADVIGKLLGFEDYIPTFNEAKATKNILRGVNYASGSAGIRNESGLLAVGDVISMDEQLQNHRIIISLITEVLGNKDAAMKHLSKCIYTVDMGNNDYTMNYFLPQLYNTSRQFNVHQYATVLIQQYSLPRIDASGLPCITKVNHMVNDLGKLLPIMEYVDETLFERRYGRIAHIMKLPVQAAAIKALLNFWDPSYRCFTFGNIDMTPTLEEYERILDFPNDNCRIYRRRRFEDTASEVVSLLGLGKISQCRVAEGGFKWKIIEARMKKNAEEGKLGDERYRLVAFAIFGLVLFPSEIGVISLEAASVFIEYEHDRINPSSAILGETMLSLNHCRTHGKGAMRCCVPMLYLWIISHIEAPRDIFNNFWWFDLRPLKITIDETWKNWDEKAWRDKYAALPSSNFKWKAPWMNNAICTMSCGSKIWVPLIGVTGYISYAPALVTRQLGGMQYTPRTLGLADFIGLFKHQPFSKEMELIRQDWERPVKVKREEGSSFETSFSHNYTVWRNEDFSEVKGLSTQEQSDAAIETQKRKRKDDEEDLRKQLDQCVIELSKSKGRQQLLENQLEEENTMRVFLNQRLEKQEKQLMSLKEWQKRAEVAEDITTGVQAELRNRIADYDELVKKNGIAEKELAKVKRATKGMNDDKETMDLKKGRKLLLKKIEVEKEKNRLANLDIEEERKVRAQYMVQIEEERNARMAAESDMRDYQKRAESSKGRMRALQAESEVREEELRELRSHYCEMEEDMSKAKQERQECQDYMDSFAVQINSKIAELDIAKEELQRTRDKLAQSEGMVRVLERSNEALGASNEAIIEDNTVFHARIRHMEKQVEQVARYAERLQQQATQVGNDASKYREYMGAMAGFIGDLANRGNAF